MDELIQLIVNGLIALFSGGAERKPPPPVQQPTARNALAPMAKRQAMRPKRRLPAMPKPPAFHGGRQGANPPFQGGRQGIKPLPAPIPRPLAPPPPPPPPRTVRPPLATPPTTPPIKAMAIRQLVRSRPSSLRTVYVLSEIIQPPVALRET
jgi:hypothetical protein